MPPKRVGWKKVTQVKSVKRDVLKNRMHIRAKRLAGGLSQTLSRKKRAEASDVMKLSTPTSPSFFASHRLSSAIPLDPVDGVPLWYSTMQPTRHVPSSPLPKAPYHPTRRGTKTLTRRTNARAELTRDRVAFQHRGRWAFREVSFKI